MEIYRYVRSEKKENKLMVDREFKSNAIINIKNKSFFF